MSGGWETCGGWRRRAARASTLALAIAAVGLPLTSAWEAWRASRGATPAWSPGAIMRAWERRCAGLRRYLDAEARDPVGDAPERLGYDVGPVMPELWIWERDFFAIQYVLAPAPMTLAPHRRRVVLNYPSDAALRAELALGRYRLLWPTTLDSEGERANEAGMALALRIDP